MNRASGRVVLQMNRASGRVILQMNRACGRVILQMNRACGRVVIHSIVVYKPLGDLLFQDVALVEFMYLLFTHVSGESYRRRLRALLCLSDVFRALINSLACWFHRNRVCDRPETGLLSAKSIWVKRIGPSAIACGDQRQDCKQPAESIWIKRLGPSAHAVSGISIYKNDQQQHAWGDHRQDCNQRTVSE